MKQRKLNYRFHNPNSAEDTAEFLCKLLVEANARKVECALQETVLECKREEEYIEVLVMTDMVEEPVGIRRRAR